MRLKLTSVSGSYWPADKEDSICDLSTLEELIQLVVEHSPVVLSEQLIWDHESSKPRETGLIEFEVYDSYRE